MSMSVWATSTDQAIRIHNRLTGNLPSTEALDDMQAILDGGGTTYDVARFAIDNDYDHSFYNVTLKNWSAPWTNRDFDVFADLNDYIATVVGFVRDNDDLDFRGVLYEDILYTGPSSLTSYAANNNLHYTELEAELELNGDPGFSLKDDLERRVQSAVNPDLAGGGASGVVTSRAGARAFLIAGTNRAAFRFTMLNHLCLDMEQVHDVSRPSDRIRQDVSRSPGGDSEIFLTSCIGCHSGMDPMTQALAYHHYEVPNRDDDPTGADGFIVYTPGTVQSKYFNNNATFPAGYITPDDRWNNYWREGKNTALGWDEALPGAGQGASGMFQELAHTQAFAQCHIQRVFKAVCLRDPADSDDVVEVNAMVAEFTEPSGSREGDMKHVFARSADYCKGE
ncbi:MAG: hypothetical protein K6L76_11590 [Agarilytica sp.]